MIKYILVLHYWLLEDAVLCFPALCYCCNMLLKEQYVIPLYIYKCVFRWFDDKYLDLTSLNLTNRPNKIFRTTSFLLNLSSCAWKLLRHLLSLSPDGKPPDGCRFPLNLLANTHNHRPAPLGDEPQVFYHLQLGFENNQISISPLVFLRWPIPDGRTRQLDKQTMRSGGVSLLTDTGAMS